MAIVLTSEQEQRIQAVVDTGAFPSAEKALDAAVSAIEAASGFEGSTKELQLLIEEGWGSAELSESEFWGTFERSTEALVAARKAASRS